VAEEMVDIHVVDDDAAFAASLARMLRAAGYSVAVYTDPAAFLDQRPTPDRGCVLTDLRMPGVDGVDLQKAVLAWERPLPVIFLSGHADVGASVVAVRAGAEDYLLKTAPASELLATIERALERGRTERIVEDHLQLLRDRFRELTPRESEVLWRVLRGHSNKRIAQGMGITERSVKRHRTSIVRKLDVGSTAELVRMADEIGLR